MDLEGGAQLRRELHQVGQCLTVWNLGPLLVGFGLLFQGRIGVVSDGLVTGYLGRGCSFGVLHCFGRVPSRGVIKDDHQRDAQREERDQPFVDLLEVTRPSRLPTVREREDLEGGGEELAGNVNRHGQSTLSEFCGRSGHQLLLKVVGHGAVGAGLHVAGPNGQQHRTKQHLTPRPIRLVLSFA